MTWPIVLSSLIGCFFIRGEAANPESAKDSVRRPIHRSELHSEPAHIVPRPSSPALCQSNTKGYLLQDLYSGATGTPGRFSERLLLRRIQLFHGDNSFAGHCHQPRPFRRPLLQRRPDRHRHCHRQYFPDKCSEKETQHCYPCQCLCVALSVRRLVPRRCGLSRLATRAFLRNGCVRTSRGRQGRWQRAIRGTPAWSG